ncbi:electron transfer flavoprotein subunit alpha/FixB family protein [Desulfoluna spongiiphila]|uniref:electron transfer flavoprotein subunit alpha/FixB family protein n=1 Tax=Desulfoluna spongiiphila TaxID=419481 RepID=UPI00125BA695|nr:electron transfer flavoprotein subunit alpha/FixB family protein [Desulfoluna spongiiphila]VVS92777.1 electron transfer flavoprotein alpha/beta-subunit n-terminal [Desulfoluna spongiiphila]
MITLIIDISGNHLPAVSMELAALALRLNKTNKSGITALVYGKEAALGARQFAEASGIETLGLVCTPEEHSAMTVATALKEVLSAEAVRYLLIPHTPWAMEVAPALAVVLGLPTISCVTEYDTETATFFRSAGGGTSRLHIKAPQGGVVTLQPGAISPAPEADAPGTVTVRPLPVPPGAVRIQSTSAREKGSAALAGARVVVSVGRGIKAREHLPLFHRFTDALPGAAKACSRPLVDMGWMPYPCQVGITGTSVSADLYIALGISGSTQHLAGIPQSTTVVSVNQDPDAAIHAVSDLIIEADLLPFMEATLVLMAEK